MLTRTVVVVVSVPVGFVLPDVSPIVPTVSNEAQRTATGKILPEVLRVSPHTNGVRTLHTETRHLPLIQMPPIPRTEYRAMRGRVQSGHPHV